MIRTLEPEDETQFDRLKKAKLTSLDIDSSKDNGNSKNNEEARMTSVHRFADHLQKYGSIIEMLSQGKGSRVKFKAEIMVTGEGTSCRHCFHFYMSDMIITEEWDRRRPPPWTGQLCLEDNFIPLTSQCKIQMVIKQLNKQNSKEEALVRIFLIKLDLRDMPGGSQTMVKQTVLSHTIERSALGEKRHCDLTHQLIFRIRRLLEKDGGQIRMEGRVRLVVTMSKAGTAMMSGQKRLFPFGNEEYLEVKTELPDNPRYFMHAESTLASSSCNADLPVLR